MMIGDDNNQASSQRRAKVHGQLTDMSKDIREMALLIVSLAKIMTPNIDSAVAQSDSIQRRVDQKWSRA